MPTIAEVRAQYPEYDNMSDVDLAGALHQKFYPDMPANLFAEKIGLKPDKYQQAAIDEQADLKAKGIDEGAGYTRRLAHGATLGADNTLIAGALAPIEAIKRGVGLGEGYNYAKAREDRIMDDARANTGMLGTGVEMLGGGVAGGGLARGGVTAARLLAPDATLLGRTAANVADATALGGVAGFNEGNGLSDRLEHAFGGALLGGGVATGLGAGNALFRSTVLPLISNIKARANPEGFANSQIARAVSESGQTPAQLGRAVEDANAAGQPFTLADALGNSGQRMLSTVTRGPGEGRTEAVRFLNNRQAGQGERVGQILDEGLGAGGTARQTMDQLTAQARAESAPLYREALEKQPVWNNRMQEFFNDPATAQGLKEGVGVQRLEALATGRKFDPNDYAITSFNPAGDPIISGVPNMRTVNLIKKGWDQMLEKYRDSTTGRLVLDETGRALDHVRKAFLNEVDGLNPIYGQARAAYAGPAQIREAVGTGAEAATRGRAADNIARFEALTNPAKQGFRTGYADTRVGAIERAPQGTNVVRPLTSQKATQELEALSLHQGPSQPGQAAPMQQRLNREQTMFETRHQALGNSKTAENFADDAALGIDPSLVGQVIANNWHGAVKSLISAGSNLATGNTPQVRAAVGRMLLDRGANPAVLERIVGETIARIQFLEALARSSSRIGSGALAVTPSATKESKIFKRQP